MDRALLRLYVGTFLFTLMMGMALPLVPQYLKLGFGADLTVVGVIFGTYGVMQIVLRLPLGDAADAIGRRRTLLGAFGLSFAGGFFYVLAPGPWWLLPGQVLFGFASGVFWVSANSYLFERAERVGVPMQTATSHYSAALGLGFLVGPPLGGFLADRYGYPAGLSVFLWASAIAILALWGLPTLGTGHGRRGNVYGRAARIFRNPDIRHSAFGTLTFSGLFGVFSAFYPVYVRAVGLTAAALGLLFAVREVTAMLVRLVLPPWLQRTGPRRVLFAGIAVAAVSVGVVPFLEGMWGLGLFAVLAGLGTGVMIPANLMLVHSGAPPEERGLANGIYGTALGLGSAASAFVFGTVSEEFGLEWAFWGATLVTVVGLVAMAAWARSEARAEPSAGAGQIP